MGNSQGRSGDSKKSSGPQPNINDAAKKASNQQQQKHEPGEGIRSMKTSGVFRALNFELYAKPNKPVMIIGGVAIGICAGYIAYMNYSYDRKEYYPAEAEDGTLILRPKKSRWES